MQWIEEYVKWHHGDAINDTLTKGNSMGQTWLISKKFKKKGNSGEMII